MKHLALFGIAASTLFGTAALAAPTLESGATAVSAKISAASVVKANVDVATVSGTAPAAYDHHGGVASVNENILLIDRPIVDAYQRLHTGVITTRAHSDYPATTSATGSSLITDLSSSLYTRTGTINLVSLGLAADVIGSTTTVGANGGGLYAMGNSTLTNLSFTGGLFSNLNLSLDAFVNAAPNTVLLDLLGLRLVLNEQITTGNGIDSLAMTTNALHLSLNDYLFNGQLLKGNVVVGGSHASITGYVAPTAPIPEPASWAMMISGLGAVGGAMRWRKTPARAIA